ncbi:hypothetical protein ELQ35_13265 [Peribacillus cavernae]|uniref:Uncharacterized protein n=1 Tax=Peribacillus cavernae TaxID=1674310 RepID=A0A3S0U1D4_9BACI|nr:hypothetical protein [Peribacillus cavernae]MDQ0217740.1 hypothetical protein [Peribacillus cavernae]RUQ28201.1 hypothetical protein ELQ35_13265 [Peribacillus cavernae]
MNLDKLEKMLSDFTIYMDCEIAHIFTRNNEPVVILNYLEDSNIYQVMFVESQITELYNDPGSAAVAIDKAIYNIDRSVPLAKPLN